MYFIARYDRVFVEFDYHRAIALPHYSCQNDLMKDAEKHIIDRLKAGDKSQLRLVYDKTADQVFTLAMKILSDDSITREVTKQCYVDVWQSRADIPNNWGDLESYIFAAAHRLAIRKREVSALTSKLDDENISEDDILRTAYLKGLSLTDLTELYGAPIEDIKTKIQTAYRKVKGDPS